MSLHTNYTYEHAPSLIPVFPVVGRNARERRRIRRANERLQKAVQAAAVSTTWEQVPAVQQSPLCTAGSSTSYTTSTPYHTNHVPTLYHTPASQRSEPSLPTAPRPVVADIRTLWAEPSNPSTAFPSYLSVPGRVNVVETPTCPWLPSSAMIIGCHDSEVDYLADLGRIMDTRLIVQSTSTKPPITGRFLDTISESGESELVSSPSSSILSSLPATPSDARVALPSISKSSNDKPIPFYPPGLEVPTDLISPLEI